jgi:membrane-associated HD superfamily phosphohydrolase
MNDILISKRGIVKVAASQLPTGKQAVSKTDVKKVLKTFEKSPDVSKSTLKQYQQRAELDTNPKQVAQDFFKDLGTARKQKKQMSLVTAMSLRQVGIFKSAGRDVYEDLETGDFWKISDDKKSVMRMFKEDEHGISDKRASIEKVSEEYKDSSEFTSDLEKVEKLVKEIISIVDKSKWSDWLKSTDENFDGPSCSLQNDVFLSGLEAFEELKNQIYKAE